MSEKYIPLETAKKYIENVSKRLALLHLAYAETIVEELGEREGKELVAKAIRKYGSLVGERVKKRVLEKGLDPTPENWSYGEDIPGFGMHEGIEVGELEGESRVRAYGCVLAKIWREYGEDELGRLYCYVDPVKYMAYNPKFKLVHIKAVPDGYDYCEFTVKPTTEEEREMFKRKTDVLKMLEEIDSY